MIGLYILPFGDYCIAYMYIHAHMYISILKLSLLKYMYMPFFCLCTAQGEIHRVSSLIDYSWAYYMQ